MEWEKPLGTVCQGPQGILTNIVQMMKINTLGPKRSIETNISKNSCFPDDKSFWPIFSRIIKFKKPQGTTHKGPQCNLAISVEVIRSFL